MTADNFPEFLGWMMITAGIVAGDLLLIKWLYEQFHFWAIAFGLITTGLLLVLTFESPSHQRRDERVPPP